MKPAPTYDRSDNTTPYGEWLSQALSGLPPDERKALARAEKRRLDQEISDIDRNLIKLRRFKERLEPALDSLNAWKKEPFVLERLPNTWLHHLRNALRSDDAIFLGFEKEGFSAQDFDTGFTDAQLFVVEHDWSAAFKDATDFSDGDFRLPFDVCAFELHISGRRVVALMTTVDDRILMQIMLRTADTWMVDDDIARHENGEWLLYHGGRSQERNIFANLVGFVGSQIRALSIALDAEVAIHEVVRAPHKLNRAREKSDRVPAPDHYVVSLARRTRAAPMTEGHEGEHGKRRLHFRRGHWRHYETHKTWIKWMLVGNPDLGFVDKEYRL